MRKRSTRHRDADFAAASVLALLDVLLVGGLLTLGTDGIWTADWLRHPGPMDSSGASYQKDAVTLLTWACGLTTLLALALRGWTSLTVQLALLGGGAVLLGSLPTYWNP